MTRSPLSRLPDWEFARKNEDVRGRTLRDPDGNPVGRIVDVVVDTRTEYVDAIVLDNGEAYAADDFDLRGGQPVLVGVASSRTLTVPLDARPTRRAAPDQPPITAPMPSAERLVVERRRVDPRPSSGGIGEDAPVLVPAPGSEQTSTRDAAAAQPPDDDVRGRVVLGRRRVEPRPSSRPLGEE